MNKIAYQKLTIAVILSDFSPTKSPDRRQSKNVEMQNLALLNLCMKIVSCDSETLVETRNFASLHVDSYFKSATPKISCLYNASVHNYPCVRTRRAWKLKGIHIGVPATGSATIRHSKSNTCCTRSSVITSVGSP